MTFHRRQIDEGGTFTIFEEMAGDIELLDVLPIPEPPSEGTRGEPWGWTKGPPYPLGWRADGRYDGTR